MRHLASISFVRSCLAPLLALAALAAVSTTLTACGDDDGGPAAIDAASADGALGIDAAPGPDGAAGNVCKTSGGICVGSDTACTEGEGTVLAAGAAGCVFSDGPGTCCEPPAPASKGESCEAQGGLCAPIAGCGFVDGAFASEQPACGGGPNSVCCLPESICGVEDVVCCGKGDAADFRPTCDRGTFSCAAFPDTTLTPEADCAP